MSEQNEKSVNPYQVPASALTQEIENFGQWSALSIKCAEKSSRCSWFGLITAFYGYIFAATALSVILIQYLGSTVETRSFGSILIVYVVVMILGFPYSKLYIRYQRTNISAKKYVENYQKSSQRFYNRPLFLTLTIPLLSVLYMLILDVYRNWTGLGREFMAVGSAVLLVSPLALPPVYFLVKHAMRKSSKLVEQMVREID